MLFQSTASICADCSLVQGQDLEALRVATPYQHIVYCGDGANDLCPALALGPTDVVLARKVQSPELAVNSLHVPSAVRARTTILTVSIHSCLIGLCLCLQGHALEKLIAGRANSSDETERVVAQVRIWNDHAQLLQLVQEAMQM